MEGRVTGPALPQTKHIDASSIHTVAARTDHGVGLHC